MSAKADRAALVQLWMQQADDELVAARHLASDFEVPDRIAAFHAHLAAEKALKAVTILRAVPVRKVHELATLAVLLPPEDIAGMDRADFDLLEPWNIEGRYPADLPDQGPLDVVRLLEAAARVVEAVKRVVRGGT
jgi:HEPN domain-containing protein